MVMVMLMVMVMVMVMVMGRYKQINENKYLRGKKYDIEEEENKS